MDKQDLERIVIETAVELKGIRKGQDEIKKSIQDGNATIWTAIDGVREVQQENRLEITKVDKIESNLKVHLTLILGIIAGIVSLGLWWMRVGMGK